MKRKEKEFPQDVTRNELLLLIGLTNISSHSEDGWMLRREITCDSLIYYKSQDTNVQKDLKPFIDKGLIEKRELPKESKLWKIIQSKSANLNNNLSYFIQKGVVETQKVKKKGSKNRPNWPNQYRLNQAVTTKYRLWGFILEDKHGLGINMIQKVLNRSYFNGTDEGYGVILDQKIKEYEQKLGAFKRIKRSRIQMGIDKKPEKKSEPSDPIERLKNKIVKKGVSNKS